MTPCPRCGRPSDGRAPFCAGCGQPLAPVADKAKLKQTMVAGSAWGPAAQQQRPLPAQPQPQPQPQAQPQPPLPAQQQPWPQAQPPAQPQPPPQARPLDPKRTVIGMAGQGIPIPPTQPQPPQAVAPAQPQPPQPQATPPPVNPHQTMLGMPLQAAAVAPAPQPPFMGKQTMLGVPAPAAPPAAPAAPAASGPTLPSAKQTMLGVALPGIAPTYDRPPAAPAPAPVQPMRANPPSAHATMLGVAVPGVAPIAPVAPPPEAAWRPPQPEEPPAREVVKRKRKVLIRQAPLYRRPAFVIALLGGMVAVIAVGVALFWPSPPPIKAEARIDDRGGDALRISCASCPDGTTFAIAGASGVVKDRVADVTLPSPLLVGDNKFVIRIDRPGTGRDEDVKLVVPISYRIRPDLSGLAGNEPSVRIVVEATRDTKVTVDGKPVALGVDGKGSHPIDVASECTGALAETRFIERKIPYEITHGKGQTDRGTVAVKLGVTPLVLESPRPRAVLESATFLIAGRTLKGAVIDIGGTQIATGADGAFARTLKVDQMGETTVKVRAVAKDQAPRIVSFTVDRVTDLEAAAKAFLSQAKVDLEALLADPSKHTGSAVFLQGEVLDSRVQGNETIVLFDAREGCRKSPCLVRVVRAGAEALPKGQKLRVFGYVAGIYEAKGTAAAPEVDMAFSLPARK